MISVTEAIAIYHNIGKSQYKSFSASPHTQLSFSLSQLLTLMQYLWLRSFNRTQRKIGAYSFASQPFTSRVMSTVIDHENSHPSGYICQDISNTMCLPKDKMQKGKVNFTLTLIRQEQQIGPSQTEAKVVTCFYGWMHKVLAQKDITLYCHL